MSPVSNNKFDSSNIILDYFAGTKTAHLENSLE